MRVFHTAACEIRVGIDRIATIEKVAQCFDEDGTLTTFSAREWHFVARHAGIYHGRLYAMGVDMTAYARDVLKTNLRSCVLRHKEGRVFINEHDVTNVVRERSAPAEIGYVGIDLREPVSFLYVAGRAQADVDSAAPHFTCVADHEGVARLYDHEYKSLMLHVHGCGEIRGEGAAAKRVHVHASGNGAVSAIRILKDGSISADGYAAVSVMARAPENVYVCVGGHEESVTVTPMGPDE